MNYCREERLYGSDIRRNDWSAENGDLQFGGGALLLGRDPRTTAQCNVYPYGGGGDVEVEVVLECSSAADDSIASGSITVHFNAQPRRSEERGFQVVLTASSIEVQYKGEVVAREGVDGLGGSAAKAMDASAPDGDAAGLLRHRVTLATLGESYALLYNGRTIAEGSMEAPYVDNEGWLRIATSGCAAAVTGVSEYAIVGRQEIPLWQKTELLYEEALSPDGFADRWILNTEGPQANPDLSETSYVFRKMSNAVLRRRFKGPLAVEYVARPVPSSEHSAGVTDAIFIWMADHPDRPLDEFFDQQTADGNASLQMLLPVPFYWVDFGGTNNATTRLRKNPYRHMMRQYTDRRRLLRKDHVYRITAVQNGGSIEFWVDGSPVIRVVDPTPLTEGHVGVRAFCSDLELFAMRVWRIASL